MSALLGSIGDLVTRAEGRPIYCSASWSMNRRLSTVIVNSFCREFPNVAFVNSRTLDHRASDRVRHWPSERERYGAGIVITCARDCRECSDPIAGFTGEHVVSIGVGIEIEGLFGLGRPVGWHPIMFPDTYWIARFAVQPFTEIQASRYARLLPASDAELFRPIIGPWPPSDAGRGA